MGQQSRGRFEGRRMAGLGCSFCAGKSRTTCIARELNQFIPYRLKHNKRTRRGTNNVLSVTAESWSVVRLSEVRNTLGCSSMCPSHPDFVWPVSAYGGVNVDALGRGSMRCERRSQCQDSSTMMQLCIGSRQYNESWCVRRRLNSLIENGYWHSRSTFSLLALQVNCINPVCLLSTFDCLDVKPRFDVHNTVI